jgi:hypothetical protein
MSYFCKAKRLLINKWVIYFIRQKCVPVHKEYTFYTWRQKGVTYAGNVRVLKSTNQKSAIWRFAVASVQGRTSSECAERSRQMIEKKDLSFSRRLQSRQVIENKCVILVKPSRR